MPDEERNRHFNDIERETDTVLHGRRMYDLMAGYWPFLGPGTAAFSQSQDRVRREPVGTRTFSSGPLLLRCVAVTA